MTTGSTTGPVAGENNATLERITLHWTAGNGSQVFDHYHFCVQADGTVVKTLPLAQKGSHTWKRNTGNVGIAFCAMADGYPITSVQKERVAKLIAELSYIHHIPLRGEVHGLPAYRYIAPDQLVPTGGTVSLPTVTDHLQTAHTDGYYPERIDVGSDLVEWLLHHAQWYLDALNAGSIACEYIKDPNA